ncbi:hypothetical protein G647_04205 [Cladophialophora carrionii CBS 160.54]|uniref:Uncharacterized protein n=1 Tax=Cladophialophora carrionii CBS 160.54 TaxID=1279043 RepID=V9DDA0_9EURO|nr:uncharacterized protein G647_04205 [Cladophialophora carrionii CBS 160.54]ETI24835.1 hypothetical protein G647_04205 [Cladophialophora carrionii CBS 160.54]
MDARRHTQAGVPPKDESFYERLNNNANNLQWYAQKFGEAMHITPKTYDAMLAIADKVLPGGKPLMFVSAANRSIRDHAAACLVADARVGIYFQRSFSPARYPHAHEFFRKAPTKLIQIVNSARRGKQPSLSGVGDRERNIGARSPRSKTCTVKCEYDSPTKSAPPPSATLTPFKWEEREDERDGHQKDTNTTPPDAQGMLRGFCVLKPAVPNTLEVMSLKYGFPVAVNMAQLFNTMWTPGPEDINIAAIRAGCQSIRQRRELPALSDDRLNFRFFWAENGADKDMDVFDDTTLRDAYRIWLAAGDPAIPFVLCADDVNVPGAWVSENMLMDR